jgi:hypothetical protein
MISERWSKPEKPALLSTRYVTVKFTYNGHGNIVRQTYHGMNDEPFHIGLDGKPVGVKPG